MPPMSWIESASAGNWTLFVVTFLAVATWESFRPVRPLTSPAGQRWGRHGILYLICGILMTATFRITPVLLAVASVNNRFGLLNREWIPFALRFAATLIILDLVRYAVHRLFHSVYFLWRVHEVHHSDPEYDVSTAGRFHPIEVILEQGSQLAIILLLAPPPLAVFVSGLLTIVLNLFVHANAFLPGWAEQILRMVFITPGMHRIHHSEDIKEQTRNLGQTFAWWDRLFGTYSDQPQAGEAGLITGIKGLQNEGSLGLGFMLAEPFQSRPQPQADPVLTRPGL